MYTEVCMTSQTEITTKQIYNKHNLDENYNETLILFYFFLKGFGNPCFHYFYQRWNFRDSGGILWSKS